MRAPWPLHLAAIVTWAVIAVPVVLLGASGWSADPPSALRGGLVVAWILAYAAATRGDLRRDEPRRVGFLLTQAACALGVVWTAQRSDDVALVFPVAAEAMFLLRPGRAVLLVAAQTTALAAIYASSMEPSQAATMTACILGGEIFGLGAGHLAMSEVHARQELARIHAELQATQGLLAQSVREAERVRITRDVHDILGHHLTALSVNLQVATHLADGKAAEHVAQAHALARQLLADVRDVIGALREDHGLDLGQALATMVAGIPQPKIHLTLPPGLPIADAALAHTVFRCVQEIVTNTVRHAHARNLWIDLRHAPGGLVVEARDDGRGAPGYAPGQGLTGMGERLRERGGSLVVASHPGRGFEVRATLPLPQGVR